ncbi:MAG: hypothetical protein ACLSHC_04565 [Bilophila wadsworthia]
MDARKLRPAFKKDGVVTAGNASGVNERSGSGAHGCRTGR